MLKNKCLLFVSFIYVATSQISLVQTSIKVDIYSLHGSGKLTDILYGNINVLDKG